MNFAAYPVTGLLPDTAPMTFEEYLTSKKIDGDEFRRRQPGRYLEWQTLFAQTHPESFTMQKKFLINDIRRLYQLQDHP